MDGSAKGKPKPAGIGSVLRYCNVVVKVVFSKFIGVVNSNVAKLLAVQKALKLFVTT